jgi:hypothetical protein
MTIRVVMIGAGQIASGHCHEIASNKGAELAAVADLSKKRREALAESFEIPYTTAKWEDVVADNSLSSAEVTNRHLDDPAVDLRDGPCCVAPLFNILLHWDIFRLPMIGLHRLVEIISPLVFQGEDVEEHRVLPVDDLFCTESLLGFTFIEYE